MYSTKSFIVKYQTPLAYIQEMYVTNDCHIQNTYISNFHNLLFEIK